MSDKPHVVNRYTPIFGGWAAIVILLVAMMHYGYSCSCAGCDLVDSTVETSNK